MLLISLFCSVSASWWVIRGGFGLCLLLSPSCVSKLPSQQPLLELIPYPAETRELGGRSLPFQAVSPEHRFPAPGNCLPLAHLNSHQGWLDITCGFSKDIKQKGGPLATKIWGVHKAATFFFF